MRGNPVSVPAVALEISGPEAKALVRALLRADRIARDAGNTLDMERLASLRECIEKALAGDTVERKVES